MNKEKENKPTLAQGADFYIAERYLNDKSNPYKNYPVHRQMSLIRTNLDDVESAFVAGAYWLLGKACEWLNENVRRYINVTCDENSTKVGYEYANFITDFRKAMEE